MKIQIGDKKATENACIFNKMGTVNFKEADGEKGEFEIVGYSGDVIPNHWYWGNVAFDLGGLNFAKKKTPVLDSHIDSRRLGFSTSQEIADEVKLRGVFLNNEDAQKAKGDLKDGFPMEASLSLRPSIIEYVKENETTEVNGHTLKGPGAVFRKALIKEVSMVVFGADSNTESKAFADGDNREIEFSIFSKEYEMAKGQTEKVGSQQTLTVDTFAAENAELFEQINKAASEKATEVVKASFGELKTACGDDLALLVECFEAGKSVNEALQMANEKLRDANTKLTDAAQKQSQTETADGDKNKQTQTLTAAEQEFSDSQGEPTKKAGDEVDESKMSEEELKKKFAESKELQADFAGNEASYLAFVKNDKAGRIKILGEKKK